VEAESNNAGFYAHFILKTKDLVNTYWGETCTVYCFAPFVKKAFRSEWYLFSELHVSEGRVVRRNACRFS